MALAPDPKQPAAPTSGKPAPAKISYVVSKPAAPTSTGTGGSSLLDLANARAATNTGAEITGIQAQQNAALQQAALRAAQQGQLGIAASKYLEGLDLPGRTTADYANAANALRASAAGFSGGLQQTVSDAAAQVQANLAAAGSSQQPVNQGEAAGNALYGLGGYLPSLSLAAIGPTAAANLRALPAQTLGYGQQLAMGELGAGQQQAAQLTPDIIAALAKQPTLAAQYLDSLQTAQAKARADAETAAYHQQQVKLAAARINSENTRAANSLDSLNQWRNAQISQKTTQQKIDVAKAQSLDNYRTAVLGQNDTRIKETAAHNQALETLSAQNAANLTAYRNSQIDLGTFNANTARINAATSRITAATKAPTTRPSPKGLLEWNPATKSWNLLPGTKPTSRGSTASTRLTQQYKGSALAIARGVQSGGITYAKAPQNVVVTGGRPAQEDTAWSWYDADSKAWVNWHPPGDYNEAIAQMLVGGKNGAIPAKYMWPAIEQVFGITQRMTQPGGGGLGSYGGR